MDWGVGPDTVGRAGSQAEIRGIIDAALRCELTEAMARRAVGLGPRALA